MKKKALLRLIGTSKGTAEDVPAECLRLAPARLLKIAIGVQLVVTQELEHIAVEQVGAALERHDDAAPPTLPYSPPPLPVITFTSSSASTFGLVADAISTVSFVSTPSSRKLLVCSRLPLTCGRLPLLWKRAAVLITVGDVLIAPGISRVRVAKLRPFKGKRGELGGIDGVAGGGRFGLENRRGAADFHGLGQLADFEFEIDARDLVDLERERAERGFLQAGVLGHDVVLTNREKRQVRQTADSVITESKSAPYPHW